MNTKINGFRMLFLIQLVGDHDLHDIENEITEIRNFINKDFPLSL